MEKMKKAWSDEHLARVMVCERQDLILHEIITLGTGISPYIAEWEMVNAYTLTVGGGE